MRVTRKGTLFRREELEMSQEEYEVYKLGRYYGIIDGMIVGVALSIAIVLITKIFGL